MTQVAVTNREFQGLLRARRNVVCIEGRNTYILCLRRKVGCGLALVLPVFWLEGGQVRAFKCPVCDLDILGV